MLQTVLIGEGSCYLYIYLYINTTWADPVIMSYCKKHNYCLDSYMLLHRPLHQPGGFTAYSHHQLYEAVIRPLHQSYMLLSEINQHPWSHSELSIHGGHGIKV